MPNIIWIDMYIRDERLLEWLREHQHKKLPAKHIAIVMKCHDNTARAMLKRLERGGRIKKTNGPRGGYEYEVVNGA